LLQEILFIFFCILQDLQYLQYF